MANYKANKNLILKTPGIYVAEGEVVELEPVYAEQVNKDLKLTFPDVDAVLVPVDTTESVEVEQPKKTTRKKKADDTETVEDAAE
ncbi:hypothetical protein [Streptococcus suis]|uniref:hypothetical protein n=1 Tax=Streptococcus suis TaxID=1307 RepID=UPI0009432B4A|nr:hypothetical protein [Streptococcus suis]